MKTASLALLEHIAKGSTTVAWCWKVTRKDARVFGFTNVDKDLVVDGVTYLAATGITPSAIESQIDLAVPNLELAGILDSEAITEADIEAGLWDGATFTVFQVNHADLTQGVMVLRTGSTGEITAGTTAFTAEGRGLAQLLQQSVGRVYAAACDANLGDSRCGFDVEALRVSGTVDQLSSRRVFGDTGRSEADDYFGAGVVRWETGDNAGLSMEVASFTVAGGFLLHLPMPYDIALGDTYTVIPGCRKRRTEDCSTKFSNVVNFRGFPDVPMNDKVLGNATASDG